MFFEIEFFIKPRYYPILLSFLFYWIADILFRFFISPKHLKLFFFVKNPILFIFFIEIFFC
jgi:hypothetical protein